VPPVAAPPAKASLDVSFDREGGVIFHALDCVEDSIDDLHSVAGQVEKLRAKLSDFVFVSHVESARRFAVLVSQGAGAALKLKGDTSAIEALNVADASVSIVESRGQLYQRHGDGPVLLRLYGFKWWSRKVQPQGMAGEGAGDDAKEARLEELSPHDPIFDA